MKRIAGWIALWTATFLLSLTALHGQPSRPRPCQKPGECVTRAECVKALETELAVKRRWANELCSLNNPLHEWDIIRRKDILPVAIPYARYYVENGFWNVSALELGLIDIYYLFPDRLETMHGCTVEFYERKGVGLLRSHDACYNIYRHHSAEKHSELSHCVDKQLARGQDAEDAMDLCIEYVFPAEDQP